MRTTPTSLPHQLERIGLIDGEACRCRGCKYVAIWVKPGIENLYGVRRRDGMPSQVHGRVNRRGAQQALMACPFTARIGHPDQALQSTIGNRYILHIQHDKEKPKFEKRGRRWAYLLWAVPNALFVSSTHLKIRLALVRCARLPQPQQKMERSHYFWTTEGCSLERRASWSEYYCSGSKISVAAIQRLPTAAWRS